MQLLPHRHSGIRLMIYIALISSNWLPSVLWHCCLGDRKGIRPVKKLSGGVHSLSLASVKSRLVFPFWYRLSRVVPDKRPLNGCVHVRTNRHTDTRLTLYTMLRKVLAWWCNVQGIGLRHKRLQVRLPAVPLAGNNLGQVVHTRHVHLSPSRIIWYRSRGGDALWLGK